MIIVVGDIVTDVLAVLRAPLATGSDTPATIHFTGGGQAANTAMWLASLGAAVTFVGAIGDDAAGHQRLAELQSAGVRTRVSVRPGAATGSIVVLTHHTGRDAERTMISDRGANLLLAPADVDAAIGFPGDTGANHLHLSGYSLLDQASRPAGRRALAAAHAAGLTTSVDAASATPLQAATGFLNWVRGVSILFANGDEASVLAGPGEPADQATRIAQQAGGVAVVKRGAAGAWWADGEQTTAVPAEPTRVVDPTGAGDAFAAGLLAAWTQGADPETALRSGAACGARAVGQVGARPSASSGRA